MALHITVPIKPPHIFAKILIFAPSFIYPFFCCSGAPPGGLLSGLSLS